MEQQAGSSLGKEYIKAVLMTILSPCLFNVYAEYIMRNAGLDEVQAGIKIARRNIISVTSDMQMTLPYGRNQRTKEPLDESEREE